jgi:signal transduction histidine kinase
LISPSKGENRGLPVATFEEQETQLDKALWSFSGHAAKTGEILLVDDMDHFPQKEHCATLYAERDISVRSELIIPIEVSGKVRRVLCLSSSKPNAFEGDSQGSKEEYQILQSYLSSRMTESLEQDTHEAIEWLMGNVAPNDWYMSRAGLREYTGTLLRGLANRLGLSSLDLYITARNNGSWAIQLATSSSEDAPTTRVALIDGSISDKVLSSNHSNGWTSNRYTIAIGKDQIGWLIATMDYRGIRPYVDRVMRYAKAHLELLIGEWILRRTRYVASRMSELGPATSPEDIVQYTLALLRRELGHKELQLWRVSSEIEEAYLYGSDKYKISRIDQTIVSQVWRERSARNEYDVSRENEKVRYPELVPEVNDSWIGIPLLSLTDRAVVGILSCFEPNETPRVHLSEIDTMILEATAAMLGFQIAIQAASDEAKAKMAMKSHQVSDFIHSVYNRLNDLFDEMHERTVLIQGLDLQGKTQDTIALENCVGFLGLAMRAMHRENPLAQLSGNVRALTSTRLLPLIAETVAMARAFLDDRSRKNIQIIYDEMDRSQVVYTHKDIVKEALLILLINAAKYSAVQCPVRVHFRPTPDRYGRLEVENIGIGILQSDEAKIFEQGYQGVNVDPSMSLEGIDRVTHKGLGLFIGRRLMRRIGGDIILVQPGKVRTARELERLTPEALSELDSTVFGILLSRRGG